MLTMIDTIRDLFRETGGKRLVKDTVNIKYVKEKSESLLIQRLKERD